MVRKVLASLVIILGLVLLYLLLWPVPIAPVAWQAPPNPGYTGPFTPNDLLKGVETLPIGENRGPEAIALDAQGRIYAATHEGHIVRLRADGSSPEKWADTGGRPLGIKFDRKDNLLVADAFRGLLKITPDGKLAVLATEADGKPILYADDLDVAADGKIYFSDASTKFGAKLWGGTYEASLLDLLEHGGHGRLLVYDPATGRATTLLDGLNFANGVAVSPDQTYVLVNETGTYRILRYWISGPRKGRTEPLVEQLPGFPDNISAGLDGRFWVALVSPRNKLVDELSGRPFLRKIVQRFPAFMRPKATFYGHIIAIDGTGRVLVNLQDPDGRYRLNTSVTETKDYLYIGSLVMPAIGRLSKTKAGLSSKELARGRYLLMTSGCNDCHTAGYAPKDGNVPEKDWLKGDILGWRGPWGTTYPTNLRLYMEKLTEDQWAKLGKVFRTRPPMPWSNVNAMTESDLRAIYKYVRSLGPAGDPAPAYLPPDKEPKPPFVQFPAPPK